MMKTLLSNVAAALALCLVSPSYASDNLNSITQEFDAVTLSTNTGSAYTAGESLDGLPYEMVLNIFQYLSVNDLRRVNRVNHKYNQISKDNSLLSKWTRRVQELNPLNPPTNNISDFHASIIESVLTNNLKFTNYGRTQQNVNGIQDNGELIRDNDFSNQTERFNRKITYKDYKGYIKFSSNDGEIDCGYIDNTDHCYPCQTIIIRHKDNNKRTVQTWKNENSLYNKPRFISADSKVIIGESAVFTPEHLYKTGFPDTTLTGFKVVRGQTNMQLLKNSKGFFETYPKCMDKNGKLIAGCSYLEPRGHSGPPLSAAAFWINDNHYVVQELPNLGSNPSLKDLHLNCIWYVSPNGKAIYGYGKDSAKKDINWSLVFGDR